MVEDARRFGFSRLVNGKPKGLVWAWNERVDPKKPKVPNPQVVAIRVADAGEKQAMLGSDPEVFFTLVCTTIRIRRAVLTRLPAIRRAALARLVEHAWQVLGPPAARLRPAPARTGVRAARARAR